MKLRFALLAIIQLWLIGNTVGVVPQITNLNVQCDRSGMRVAVNFDTPFNGIIFSKGHYSDLSCRYLTPRSSRTSIAFFIPSNNCGTIQTDLRRDGTLGFKNVLIIQNDPDYQEVWDMARKISCDWVTRIDKHVTWAPFGVDMLNVKELAFPGDTVDCWMDIQRGHGPFAPTIAGIVPIGEKITIVVYIRDKDNSFDIHVKDCYAYDSPDYKNPNVRAIQLTDARGCAIKEKLVRGFYRTRDVRNSGATVIAYGIINAFKFPEAMDVFLACNVEVCKGGCDNPCQPEVQVAGGDGVEDEQARGPFTRPPFDTQQKNVDDEDESVSSTLPSNDVEPSDDGADEGTTEASDSASDAGEDSSSEDGGSSDTDTSSEGEDTEAPAEASTEAPTETSSEADEEEEAEEDSKAAAASNPVARIAVKTKRAKKSSQRRRHTGPKTSAKIRAKPKSSQKSAKIIKRKGKAKVSAITTTPKPTTRVNKRGKRSILISTGTANATFYDMSHSISIISPVEDFDDKELEIWQNARQDDQKLCFSALSLLASSIALTTLAILFTSSLLLSYGKLRQSYYPQKSLYHQPNGASTSAEFAIPVDSCGTNTLDIDGEDGTPPKRGFENILVFQNDPTYQEVWDHARMVVCRYTLEDDFDLKEKRVVFRPVVIDMLDVVSIPVRDADGQQSRVDCWMEITKGRFPATSPIDSAVKVGSPLTLAIFVRDPRKRTDLRVKDCYAYDDPQVAESNGPALLQLTDFDGCPTKPKLIEVWRRTHDAGPTGATIIAFTTVTAFKFPDRPDLQLTCNIELCRNQCSQRCSSEMPGPVSIGSWTREIEEGGPPPAGGGTDGKTTERPPTQTTEETEDEDSGNGADGDNESDGDAEEATTPSTTTAASEDDNESEDADEPAEATTAATETEEEDKEEEEEEESEETAVTTTEASEESGNDESDDSDSDSDSASTNGETAAEGKEGEETEAEDKEEESETEAKEEEADTETNNEGDSETSEPASAENEDESENEEDDTDEETAESSARIKAKESPAKKAKAKAKALTTSTTTTTTTTTPSTTTTTKKPKAAKKSKSKSKTKTTTPKPAPKSAAQVRPNDSLNSIVDQVHWSTSTLRPLRELMDVMPKSKTSSQSSKKSKKSSTTTTTTTTPPTTTTTTTPSTTTRSTTATKSGKKSKKSSTRKSSMTTAKPTNQVRRARAPSSSHPDEFPHLHLLEARKRVLPTRRPNPLFKSSPLESMSETKSTAFHPNVSTVVISEVLWANSSTTTNRPLTRSYNFRNNGQQSRAELHSVNENPLLRRRQSFRRRSDTSEDPNFEAFHNLQRFQAMRLSKPHHRVVRSVDLRYSDPNSKTVIFHTRIHSAIQVI